MIILMDVLINIGVIDLEVIVQQMDGYCVDVELSYLMIGVGVDFNYVLICLMMVNGCDQVYFISNLDDI